MSDDYQDTSPPPQMSPEQIAAKAVEEQRKWIFDPKKHGPTLTNFWHFLLAQSSPSNVDQHWRRVECAIADKLVESLNRIALALEKPKAANQPQLDS